MILLMEGNAKSIWKSDVTKYMAVLYLGYILGRSSESLPYIISVPLEIIGFASIVVVIIHFVVSKVRKSSKAL